jgi:hypothetical protein
MAGTTIYTVQTTNTSLLTTEMNSLANAAFAVSSVGGSSGIFNNTVQTVGSIAPTANLGGYLRAFLELVLAAPTGAFAANSAIYLWFLKSIDGSNFEDTTVTPRPPDVIVPIEANSSAQRITMDVKLPQGVWKLMAENVQGSSTQALASSGNKVTIQPYTAGE